MHNINVREGLRIKNHFTVFGNKKEVQLRHGRTFKCDIADLDIVEEYIWGLSGSRYVTTNHSGFTLTFHNIVMNHVPTRHTTVDHIDRNPLNCCRSNLLLGLKISIVLWEKIIPQVLLEFIITDSMRLGLQCGTKREGTNIHKCYLDMDLKLPKN